MESKNLEVVEERRIVKYNSPGILNRRETGITIT